MGEYLAIASAMVASVTSKESSEMGESPPDPEWDESAPASTFSGTGQIAEDDVLGVTPRRLDLLRLRLELLELILDVVVVVLTRVRVVVGFKNFLRL
jgi:hypothetical protein